MPASRSLLALGFSLLLTDAAAAEAFRFQGRVDVIPAKVVDATEKALASPTCTGQEDGARTASVPASGVVTVTVAPVDEASGNAHVAMGGHESRQDAIEANCSRRWRKAASETRARAVAENHCRKMRP